ncbi:MAG: pyridoxal phosphate-dependent aminotransferase [Planctomycetota bacterium]|nr:pyridoxal phosphate-dependent aminotransferase [Planctomycetota bacterium]
MKIEPFLTEQFFAQYEFSSPHLLASSDCETLSIGALLEMSGSNLEELAEVTLGYTESQGNFQLRSQIAEMYTRIHADDVIVLTSPVEGIYITMQSLLEPDDEVIALRPAYDALNNVARHLCRQVVPWDLVAEDGRWSLNLDQLEAHIGPQTRMIVINFPHNPTGMTPSTEEFKRLVTLARKHQVWLFCDEIYRGLEFQTPIASAADAYENSIVLGGLSKTYGLPGLRAGWLIVRNQELRGALINWKHYTTICPAAPTEFLARKALDVRQQLADRSKSIIAHNLDRCHEFFSRFADVFTWRPPQAGSVAFVELNLTKLGFDSATDYCHHLARDHGIVLLPGGCLGAEDRFMRIGLGRKAFDDSLKAYEAVVTASVSQDG